LPSVRLAKRTLLRKFDKYYAYNALSDELYELDEEAFIFLLSCDGKDVDIDEKLLRFLLDEGLVELSDERIDVGFVEQDEPSLRYLLANITWNCNLKCKHCYVSQEENYMSFETFKKTVDDFNDLGGLKLLISGGEPLLHPEIFQFLEYARKKPFRIVLLTNSYLIDEKNAELVSEFVDEVQISLDGLEGHRKLRGMDWREVLEKIELLTEMTDISVSTMVTRYNINEFEEIEKILRKLKVRRWMIDVPTTERDIIPSLSEIKHILTNFGFGELAQCSAEGFACGAHFCSITPEGFVTKCGFFETGVGSVLEGLDVCWERMKKEYIWSIEELECKCGFVDECRGGCRYRAMVYSGDLFLHDPVMCSLFGIER